MFSFIFNTTYAFYFQVNNSNDYLEVTSAGAKLTNSVMEASDVKLVDIPTKSLLYSGLMLGTTGINCENGKITSEKFDATKLTMAFTLSMTYKGTFIIKHEDKCFIKKENNVVGSGDCKSDSVLEFTRVNGAGSLLGRPASQVTRSYRTIRTTKSSRQSHAENSANPTGFNDSTIRMFNNISN